MPKSVLFACLIGALPWAVACRAKGPPGGLEETCAQSCEVRASQCSEPQCNRGCNLVVDRLAENQGDDVLACVAAANDQRCDDRTWARCATRLGPHADGGPPAPRPPPSLVDDIQGD